MSAEAQPRTWSVAGDDAGRLDSYLAARCSDTSRSHIQKWIAAGLVLVNGQVQRASYRLAAGDTIILAAPAAASEPPAPLPPAPALEVIYEDEALLVLNKPAGIIVHPGAGPPAVSLAQMLTAHRPALLHEAWPDPQRPGIVHRLDKDTTGILLAAATPQIQAALQAQFKVRTIEKSYLALLNGRLEPAAGLIDAPLGRHPRLRQRRAVVPDGRPARTRYRVIEQFRSACYAEAQPLTGRTHQLRVHFAAVGHAVVGDAVYGPRKAPLSAARQMLHAWRITFDHPLTGARLTFEAPPPADFLALLAELERPTI